MLCNALIIKLIISLDDAVLGKPYSQHIDLIGLSGLVNTLVQ